MKMAAGEFCVVGREMAYQRLFFRPHHLVIFMVKYMAVHYVSRTGGGIEGEVIRARHGCAGSEGSCNRIGQPHHGRAQRRAGGRVMVAVYTSVEAGLPASKVSSESSQSVWASNTRPKLRATCCERSSSEGSLRSRLRKLLDISCSSEVTGLSVMPQG